MRKFIVISLMLLLSVTSVVAQEDLLINTYNRNSTSLNGEWNYIVDPYENGYYNYRYEAFDQSENPDVSAYFLNSRPKTTLFNLILSSFVNL